MTHRFGAGNKGLQKTYVLVLNVFEQFELAIRPFAEDWGTKRFHDLLDGHGGSSQLIF